MKTTGNYGLKKPDGNDVVNIDDLNYNSDVIDRKLKEVENKASNIKVPVTSVNGKTGNVVLTADNIKVEGSKSLKSQIDDITNIVGNKNSLRTSNKSNLVNAINELFQCGNNVKSNTVDALLRLDDSLQLSRNSNWSEIIKQIANVETGYNIDDKIDALNLKYDNGFKGTTMLYKHDEIYGGYELLEVDSNGYFYASAYNGGLTKTSSEGKEIWKINLDHPNDLVIDSKGNIYTVHNRNSGNHYINLRKISPAGKELWKKDYGYNDLKHITLDNNDNIYVGYNDSTRKITKLDSNGNEIANYDFITSMKMLIDKSDNMYLASNNTTGSITKLNSKRKKIWQFVLKTYEKLQCFTVDIQGNVYIGGPDNTLIKLSPEGKEIWRKKLASSDICYVITDDKGYVYYYNYNYIGKIDATGKEIWKFQGFKDIAYKNSMVSNIKLGIFYLDKIGEYDNRYPHTISEIKKIEQVDPHYTVLK